MGKGFYKNENGNLIFAPNYVISKEFTLTKEKRLEYSFPINGWFWFDSEIEAKEHFGIPVEDSTKETDNTIN